MDNNSVDDFEYEDQLERTNREAELEALRQGKYIEVFQQTNPKPEPMPLLPYEEFVYTPFDYKGTGFLEERGVEAAINVIATIGGILFSAIRTAGIFAIAEAKLLATYAIDQVATNIWSGIAGISAIAIIEGVLAGFGWVRGRNSNKVNMSWAPIIIAGIVAALAGVLPAFELLPKDANTENIHTGILILLAIVSGPGIGYLVYVVTENFGVLHNAWEADLKARIKEHEDKQELLRTQVDVNNQQIEQRNMDIAENNQTRLNSWFQDLQTDYRQRGRPVLYGADRFVARRRTNHNGNGHEPQERQEKKLVTTELQQRVIEWLNSQNPPISPFEVGTKEGDLVSPKKIAEALSIFIDDDPDKGGDSSDVRVVLHRLRKKIEREQANPPQ